MGQSSASTVHGGGRMNLREKHRKSAANIFSPLARAFLILALAAPLQAQDLPVVGGKAVLTIVPDTVLVTDTVTLPPIILPPDTIIVTDTVFVSDTVEVCPEGWTCTPPPEPEGPVWVRSTANTYPQSDTLQLGTALPSERVYLWLEMEPDTAIRVVANYVGGIPEGNEYVFPYALKGDGGNPQHLYGWVVPDSLAGPVEVRAIIHYNDASVKRDTIVGVIEIENPTEPPDTVPPVPAVR